MTKTKTKTPIWDEDPIILALVLISISITFIGDLISCLFNLNNSLSPKPSATNQCPKTKVSSSSRQRQTSRTHQKVQCPAPETSTETRRESSVASGFQPEATTRQRKRTNSPDGTRSQRTKTSSTGRLTASVAPQQVMR